MKPKVSINAELPITSVFSKNPFSPTTTKLSIVYFQIDQVHNQ